MSLIYSIIIAAFFVIVWFGYRFWYNKAKFKDKHILHLFAVAFLGPVVLGSIEMIFYGTTGDLFFAKSINGLREAIGLGGLILGVIAIYVFYKELNGDISDDQ